MNIFKLRLFLIGCTITSLCCAQEKYTYIQGLPFSAQKKLGGELLQHPEFVSELKVLHARNYNSYDMMQTSSAIINSAYNELTLNGYKTKGINFMVDVSQDYLNKIFDKTLLGPVISNSVDFIQTEWTNGALAADRKQLESAIEQAFAGYMKDIYIKNPQVSDADVAGHLKKFIEMGVVKSDEYGVIGKDVDKYLLGYVVKNNNRMHTIASVVKNQMDKHAVDVKDINGNIADLKQGQQRMTTSLISIEEIQQAHMVSFNKFQDAVYKKFEGVYNSLETMGKEIESNTQQIKKNSNQIAVLQQRQNKTESELKQLNDLQADNRQRISENSYKIGVISSVLYDNAGTQGKIELIQSGAIELKNPRKEIDRLKAMQQLENFNHKLQIAGESLTLAKNLGLSDQDARRASRVLEAASIIAQGVSAYYTGNVLGGLQTVNAIFAFGKGAQSSPSPEFTQVMQQLQEIKAQLNVIEKKIDVLNTKVDSLIRWEFQMHEQVMGQLENIDLKLKTVDSKINYIITLLTSDCNMISDMNGNSYNILIDALRKARSLKDYTQIHASSNSLRKLLNCVNQNVVSADIASKSFLHYNRIDADKGWQVNIYEPAAALLKDVFPGSRQQQAMLFSLAHPVLSNSEVNRFGALAALEDRENVSPDDLKIFINPVAVGQLAELLLLLEPYYLLGDVNANLKPYELTTFGQEIKVPIRNSEVEGYFNNLLKMCDYSIAQQSLISGGPFLSKMHAVLLQNANLTPETTLIDQMLSSDNYYLKINLASYILSNELNRDPLKYKVLADLIKSGDSGPHNQALLKSFNGYLNYTNLAVVSVGDQVAGFKVMLQITNKINNKKYLLPIAAPEKIMLNEMIYPSAIYHLIEVKKKLIAKTMEYNYTQEIGDKDDLKKYVTTIMIN